MSLFSLCPGIVNSYIYIYTYKRIYYIHPASTQISAQASRCSKWHTTPLLEGKERGKQHLEKVVVWILFEAEQKNPPFYFYFIFFCEDEGHQVAITSYRCRNGSMQEWGDGGMGQWRKLTAHSRVSTRLVSLPRFYTYPSGKNFFFKKKERERERERIARNYFFPLSLLHERASQQQQQKKTSIFLARQPRRSSSFSLFPFPRCSTGLEVVTVQYRNEKKWNEKKSGGKKKQYVISPWGNLPQIMAGSLLGWIHSTKIPNPSHKEPW